MYGVLGDDSRFLGRLVELDNSATEDVRRIRPQGRIYRSFTKQKES